MTTKNNRLLLGRLVCLFLLFFIANCSFAQTQVPTPAAKEYPIITNEDADGDGLKDASIETDLLRVIISSKTGDPAVFYLKGSNFEENMYPPVLQDMGYGFASQTMKPFSGKLSGFSAKTFGYQINVEEKNSERVVIKATANLPGSAFQEGGLSLAKRYVFVNKGYHFDVEYVVSNLADKLVAVGDEKSGAISFTYGPGIFLDPFGPSTIIGLKQGDVVENFNNIKFRSFYSNRFPGFHKDTKILIFKTNP